MSDTNYAFLSLKEFHFLPIVKEGEMKDFQFCKELKEEKWVMKSNVEGITVSQEIKIVLTNEEIISLLSDVSTALEVGKETLKILEPLFEIRGNERNYMAIFEKAESAIVVFKSNMC